LVLKLGEDGAGWRAYGISYAHVSSEGGMVFGTSPGKTFDDSIERDAVYEDIGLT
jgi:hypothetical protein